MSDQRIYIAQDTLDAGSEGNWMAAKGSKMGFQVVQDFYTQMAVEGRAYQVRAGTVTTHLTGDVEITDTKAEACADAGSAVTIIPCYLNVHIEALGGTVPIITAKSVATVSSAGAAFIPLPLKVGGIAASSTARVAGAGGVTVTAELATTTLRHYSATLATADMIFEWEPRLPPVLSDGACFYVQVAGTTTGPNYYANFDYIELATTAVS
jgi:hypothetical protein